jgi:ABC-type sugar transport system ATPase subunit
MSAEISDALKKAELDPNVTVILLKGAGPCFSSGYDMGPTMGTPPQQVGTLTAETETGEETVSVWDHRARVQGHIEYLLQIWNNWKPVIAQVHGEALGGAGPAVLRQRGLRYVPEQRLGHATVPEHSLSQNVLLTRAGPDTLRHGWLRPAGMAAMAAAVMQRFGVRAAGVQAQARSLSGGNLQKYIVGREVSAAPRILLLAQPTWGVDVGAAAQLRSELLALRDAGVAILLLSEDLDELFALSDRLQVMAGGRLSLPVPTAQMTLERLGRWMSGLWEETQHAA